MSTAVRDNRLDDERKSAAHGNVFGGTNFGLIFTKRVHVLVLFLLGVFKTCTVSLLLN